MKMYLIFGLAGCLIVSHSTLGQTKAPNFFLRRYIANVRLAAENRVETGVLFDLDDSTLTLAPIRGLKPKVNDLLAQHGGTLPPTDSLKTILGLRTYRYALIRRFTLRRRGTAGKGFLIGAGVGILSGLISGDDPPGFISFSAADKALIFSIPLSAVGLIIGAAIVQRVNAKEQSIAAEIPKRFRKVTITEQIKQANLSAP